MLLAVLDNLLRVRRIRWRVYNLPDDFSVWSQAERDLANRLSLELERIAYLCQRGLIEPDLVMGNQAAVFVTSWRKMRAYIYDLRRQSGQPQRDSLERFAAKCEEFLRERGRQAPNGEGR